MRGGLPDGAARCARIAVWPILELGSPPPLATW